MYWDVNHNSVSVGTGSPLDAIKMPIKDIDVTTHSSTYTSARKRPGYIVHAPARTNHHDIINTTDGVPYNDTQQ